MSDEPTVADVARLLLIRTAWRALVTARHVDELLELGGDITDHVSLTATVERQLHPSVAALVAAFGVGVDLPVGE